MNKENPVYLVYQKDFSERGNDRYFIYDGYSFSEVNSEYIVSLTCFVVTHDFWLISTSLYKKHSSLPLKVIDVVLLSKIVTGSKSLEGELQNWDISKTIKPLFKNDTDFDSYIDMYYRRQKLTFDIYLLFSHKLAEYFDQLSNLASEKGELERFYSLEVPVFNELTLSSCRGVRVNNEIVREHKTKLKLDFYRQLKLYAEVHEVLYEIPCEEEIKEKLSKLGYKVDQYSLEYLIDFLPSRDGYTDDLRSLQKLNKSYRVFNSIPSSSTRLRPIVESHWTSTSRIYHMSPSLQNISKKYRNIFIPDDGMALCYVDYDQFEVGIMAALSSDPKMHEIYENSDAYKGLAVEVFDDESMRNKAKILFLSYTYGMSLDNIFHSVKELKGNVQKAREYFSEFPVFETWKESIHSEFYENGRISTISANFLNRGSKKELSEKEKRSSVNHVIQGSATYIFKKALLKVSKLKGIQILIPMHDAILFQHTADIEPSVVVTIFEEVMTEVLAKKVTGKASIEPFYRK